MEALKKKALHANEFWVFLVVVALALIIQVRSGQFFTANNLVDLAGAMVVPGLFAVAAHLVLVSGGIDVSFLLLVAVVAAAFFLTRYTMFGRGILAIGGDEAAAARAGFSVAGTKFWLYVIVGIIAAMAGMVRTCSMGQMHPTNLLGMEMMVIAAVVLGGTAITGGKGSLTGVMLGTLLIVIVQNSMILTGIPTIWQNFALGLLIIVGTGISAVQVARSRGRTA